MATGAVTPPPLAGARCVPRGRGFLHRRLAASPMKDESMISTDGGNEETDTGSLNVARGLSHPGLSSSLSNKASVVPTPLLPSGPSDLRFNRLRPSIDESDCKYKRLFGYHVAREAVIDEEYWIAAWLRAEDHYENESGNRYVESFKRKFASKEFHALKKRCSKQHGEKYICFVAVKNDDLRRTVLNSVVGTLDVCVRHPLHGEKFPEEPGRSSLHCRIYQPDQPKFGYVTNVCVAKYARRQGIASNMLLLAIDAARLNGAENIYIHVHKDNLPAWRLYDQIGFKMVDQDGACCSSDLCLLSFSS
ncbi:GCN5-related N-acetyltransferase 6, chloroplastic-like [Miscanthus floridulus]|uniref:GCN5-related N-acetyltransferase 6, chloroplastic-like n=1 Tax=Miscanthus floridulus TaxID=154761 RepID=UPI0034587D87